MIFEKAKSFVIPWGDYKGETIDQVAQSDSGLRGLDKLLSWMEDKQYRKPFREALESYLSDPSIKKELEKL